MSVSVALSALADRVAEFGPVAHLVTVGDEGSPHVVSVTVGWDGDDLATGAGTKTARNAGTRPAVTLLWPAPPGDPYSLIVDGQARVVEDGREIRIRPSAAVLHRVAGADSALASCVTVLE